MKLQALSDGFLFTRHFRIQEPWNLLKNDLQGQHWQLQTCVVVNKAFKQVAEEQTKIEQVRSQLKALECDSEHAGQTADALDNLPVF